MSGRWKEVTPYISGPSVSRSSRAVDGFMILCCTVFVLALCTSFTAAAQNPNLLEQMEGDFNELSSKAVSWSMYPVTDTDTLAQNEYDIGLWSESACWELEPEQGKIEILEQYLPEVIPLCIDQALLDQWGIYVHVYGGYEIKEIYLSLYQKDYGWRQITVVPTLVPGACCSDYYYKINFTLGDYDGDGVVGDTLCFDANNFPFEKGLIDNGPFYMNWEEGNVLDKEIYAVFCSLWSGCEEPTQEFTISLVHSSCMRFEPCVSFSIIY